MTPRRTRPAAPLVLLACLLQAAHAASPAVVLNEIHYHPPDQRDDLQFVELHNTGDTAADLSGWQLARGVRFTFPTGTSITPHGFLVVCANPVAFSSVYGAGIPAAGPFTGRLKHSGESLELRNARGEPIDVLSFADSPPWPERPDGDGSTLERACPTSATQDPHNWQSSPPWDGDRLGSPGATNGAASHVPPPRISHVETGTHTLGQPLEVRATAESEAGVESVVLAWKRWPATEDHWQSTPMTRASGTDTRGTWHAQLPPWPANQLLRFRVRALSANGSACQYPANHEARSSLAVHSCPGTNTARIPLFQLFSCDVIEPPAAARYAVQARPTSRSTNRSAGARKPASRWESALVITPPGGGTPVLLDAVRLSRRHGGYKVHLLKDETYQDMTGLNLIFEDEPRRVLSEHLAYDLYRKAGVPTPLSGHVRLVLDDQRLGYHLLVEQPGGGFLRRMGRPTDGNLYKVLWYGQGLEGQHEKKSNPHTGHADLRELVRGLNQGDASNQWAFIQRHVAVPELVSYYAVNMCIQNWDGFFNNYFAYHDPRPEGRWTIFPWDEDKTWGDFDGAWSYRWCSMPLTFGMAGDRPPWTLLGGGPHGGPAWWRAPGVLSGPLLANPEFRQRFLRRLHQLCQSSFTPEYMGAAVNGLAYRLEPEIPLRAALLHEDPARALKQFHADIESFHRQIRERRRFILRELPAQGFNGSS